MAPPMTLPSRGPYDPEYADLPTPKEGRTYTQFPFDEKYLHDPNYYDALGRSLVEQRKILTRSGRSDEERIQMIKDVLDECPKDSNGEGREWSICLEVAMKGNGAVMRYLVLEKGMTVANAPERMNGLDVEMLVASYNGLLDVVQVLVEDAGVEVNVETDSGTALRKAMLGSHSVLTRWLLDHGADPSAHPDNCFRAAVRSGDLEIVEMILNFFQEKDPAAPTTTWIKGDLLGEAARIGSVELMQFIIEKGEYKPANESNEELRALGLDAIVMALKNDKTDLVCLDLAIERAFVRDESGAIIRIAGDENGVLNNLRIAIGIACNRGKPDDLRTMLTLLFKSTTIQRESDNFRYILKHAIRRCYDPVAEGCARELLERWDANPNASDETDIYTTPLTGGAIGRENVQWVKFWLDHGADIHQGTGPYCNGPTALSSAIKLAKNPEIVRLLLDRGGPTDRMDEGLIGEKQICVSAHGADGESFYIIGTVELEKIAKHDDAGKDAMAGDDGMADERGADNDDEVETPSTGGTQSTRRVVLQFEDGVTQEWLDRIQYRKPDAKLLEDGTGRPVRPAESGPDP